MFEEAQIKPVEHMEKVKKPRKKRAPMTEAQKEVLRERLKKAREAKKAKKEGKAPAPKVVKVETPKVEIQIEDKPPIKTFKAKRVKPTHDDNEMETMKKELLRLQTRNKQNEKELMKASLEKEKLKKQGLDYIAAFEAKQLKKMPTIKEDEIDKPAVSITPVPPKQVKPKRYSTYKKSIWTKYVDQ